MLGENGMRRLVNRLEKRGRYAEAAAMEERIRIRRGAKISTYPRNMVVNGSREPTRENHVPSP